jgi:hypothetical protein
MNAKPTPRLQVSSPDSVLAVIPALLGFHPANSLVIIGTKPPRGRIEVAFRYDLPEPPDTGAAAKIAAHAVSILARQQLPTAIVAGYGPEPTITPVADALVAGLRQAGITLYDMLRVEGGRYWSYGCQDPQCCPPEGTPFDPSSHPAAISLAAAGGKALRDRAALAATIAPVNSGQMCEAIRQVEQCIADIAGQGTEPDHQREATQHLVRQGLHAVREALDSYRNEGSSITDDQYAWLAVALTHLRVRDDAWARMVPEHADAHLRLWTFLVQYVPARYVPAPASLLAFTAWQSGNGALANIAAERALAADPDYSMAQLLLEAISAGLPPAAARLPMAPEEVAASYAEHDGTTGSD